MRRSGDTEERRRRQWICEGCERTQKQQRDGEYQFIAKGCPEKQPKPNLTAVNIDQLPEPIDVYTVHLRSHFFLQWLHNERVQYLTFPGDIGRGRSTQDLTGRRKTKW